MFHIKSILAGLTVLFILASATALEVEGSARQHILVNVPSKTIALYAGEALVKEYPIAVGKTSTPTPLGQYSIISKEINPSWYPPERPGVVVAPGPGNPLGRRWMGFIGNSYGVHGTNNPSSIGRAVTNGCIRMQNADVEELFELVKYNTPVKITYDLARVSADTSGHFKFSVYPDIYGRGRADGAAVKNVLEKYGLSAFVDDEYLAQMLNESTREPVDIIKTVDIMINGEIFNAQGILTRKNTYIPLGAAAANLAENYSAQGGGGGEFFLAGSKKIPVFSYNNTSYIAGADFENLLVGRQSWSEDGRWSFEKTIIYLNGEKTSLEAIKLDDILAVPLNELTSVLKRSGRLEQTSQIFFLENENDEFGVRIQPKMFAGVAFLPITKIYEYFDTFVYWNIQNNTIELTYPSPKK